MAQERWRQQGDNRPQAARDQFVVDWNQRQLQAQEEERRQNAQEARQRQQAQQPPPELHMHVAAPRVDNRPPLERMGDNVEEAIRDENDSRIAQARENKRMGFARDMEAMRQEGLLKRLQTMNDSAYEPPAPPGGGIGVWNPITQQFDYTDRVKFGP
jgi:hypothetical protein